MSSVTRCNDDSVQENVILLVYTGFATRRARRRKTRVLDLLRPAHVAGLFFVAQIRIMAAKERWSHK